MVKENTRSNKYYLLFQLIGWSMFYIFYCYIAVFSYGFKWSIFQGYFITMMIGIVLTHLYRILIIDFKWEHLGFLRLSIYVLLASIIIGLIWSTIVLPINAAFFVVSEDQSIDTGVFIVVALNFSLIIAGWSTMYFMIKFFINYKSSEIEKWRLQAAVKDAELIALKSQINPHFIFNCLNNIRSLVSENPEKSRDMITHLSDLLRYTIQFDNKETVSLENEIEVIKHYLNLESIQFEDRLKYTFDISEETSNLPIPPMAVQLLVENAIKHGIATLPEGGEIVIKTYLDQKDLVVEVINSGQLNEKNSGPGIGLKNASERLKLLFGKISNVELTNLENNLVKASFKISYS